MTSRARVHLSVVSQSSQPPGRALDAKRCEKSSAKELDKPLPVSDKHADLPDGTVPYHRREVFTDPGARSPATSLINVVVSRAFPRNTAGRPPGCAGASSRRALLLVAGSRLVLLHAADFLL